MHQMILKKSTMPWLIISVALVLAGQSCTLTSNKAAKPAYTLPVTSDVKTYLAAIQQDSSKTLVSLTNYLQPLFKDLRYNTKQNFTKKVLYRRPEAYLRLPAAQALKAVQEELMAQNLALKIYDAYRPYHVTVAMWEVVPDERYAANPAKGSGHNRGVAVDLTLVDLSTGKELPMPTDFDDFTEKAHHNYMALSPEVLANRRLLRSMMEKHGFVALETEWWHYYLPNPTRFELLDLDFDELKKIIR